ncbi:MAG: putative oxygen-independent coproporphyrinogen III oxidase, partial [Oceanicoccus sp.]
MANSAMKTTNLPQPPLSLYIHIPWCTRKCPYCDFNSHVSSAIPEDEYTIALIEDLDQDLDKFEGRELQSIFFGGGTPSLFSAKSIGKILQETNKRLRFAEDIEITLEANPGSIEQKKFSNYRAAGINRLSIGVQSFNQQHLQKLGRIHSNEEAVRAIAAAKTAGFSNFNIDLMHGLP